MFHVNGRERAERGFQTLERILDHLREPAEARGPVERTATPVDVIETQDALVLSAEVPGLELSTLDLTVENRVLTLSGERKVRAETGTYQIRERKAGRFHRSFTLSDVLDTTKIEAQYKDGVLEITVPKVAEQKPRKINVKAP